MIPGIVRAEAERDAARAEINRCAVGRQKHKDANDRLKEANQIYLLLLNLQASTASAPAPAPAPAGN